MELLSELIYILKRNDVYPPNELLPKGSKARKLFNVISKGKVLTDEEAAQIIYKGSHKDKKYLMLKRNLVKTLSETVLSVSKTDAEFINYQKFLFKGKKELMIAEKLLNQNVYHNAERIISKVKSYSERYQILELQIDCIKLLRTVYKLKGYPKEVELYTVVLKKLRKFSQYEQDAAGFIDLLESKVKYSIGKYREIAMEARHYSIQVKEWQKESSLAILRFYQYKIDLIMCYHANDIREWNYTLSRLNDLLEVYPFLKTETLLLNLNIEWIKYMRCLGNIKEASVYLEKALHNSEYAAFNKFEVQSLNFDLKIKEEGYEQAGKILKEVKKCPQFQLLESPDHAAWLLRESYLYFIFRSLNDGESIEKYISSSIRELSVSSLVNTCKSICRDKKGYNLMLVILKELMMQFKYPDEAEGGGNNLLVYYQRYMKDSCEERSRSFMKKFARAARGNFSEKNLSEKTFLNKVSASGFDAAELIPYENLSAILTYKKTDTLTGE